MALGAIKLEMKKISVFLFIISVMVCAGCGSDGRQSPLETPAPTCVETPTVQPAPVESPLGTSPTETPGTAPAQRASRIEPFQTICQYPELPTGCEMTSLTMVLNYNGIPADKCDIADNYLDKGEVGTVDFRVAFEGNPRDENSYGCYSPVVVDTANKYLQAVQSDMRAVDLSGTEFEELFSYIDAGVPVIVWGTLDCAEGHYSVTWTVNGTDLTWYTPEHCMVLVGYEDKMVWVADPVYGDVRSYDREIFKSRYEVLYRQAVVIE